MEIKDSIEVIVFLAAVLRQWLKLERDVSACHRKIRELEGRLNGEAVAGICRGDASTRERR